METLEIFILKENISFTLSPKRRRSNIAHTSLYQTTRTYATRRLDTLTILQALKKLYF